VCGLPIEARVNAGGTFLVKVFIATSVERESTVASLLSAVGLSGYSGRSVAVKANFNSGDPFPASTSLDTLRTLVTDLRGAGARDVMIGERSGMGKTRTVLEGLGVVRLGEEMSFGVKVLDELPADGWEKIDRHGTHWLNGFHIARMFIDAERVVQTCCLKTHRFGGHFTMSLKNSVGLVAARVPGHVYEYMAELHTSPYQRKMIAEINAHYRCDLVLIDGTSAFIGGGPEKGELAQPGIMLASTDRVAIDVAGVAVLRSSGATGQVSKGKVFEQEQIARAAELAVGVSSSGEVEIVPIDDAARLWAEKIAATIRAG